jgi:probable F420-dependent oxidoreductase
MDWGIHLPHLGREVGRKSLMTFAQESERAGAHSVWVSDHLCWPADINSKYPYTDDGSFGPTPDMGWLEAIGTLTFVAGCTETVRLGTSVLILPYRPPVLCAKQLATLDVLSGGRLLLGVGVGWMAEEAAVLGMPWAQRGKRSDEYLALLHTLFTEHQPTFDGEFYQLPAVGFEPKPIQQPLPTWVGGNTPAAFRRVARFGNVYHAAFEPLATVTSAWSQIHQACAAIGRNPAELSLSLRIYLDPAGAMPAEKSIAGSREQMVDTINALKEAGVSHVMLDPVARGGVEGRQDAFLEFMSQVAPHV